MAVPHMLMLRIKEDIKYITSFIFPGRGMRIIDLINKYARYTILYVAALIAVTNVFIYFGPPLNFSNQTIWAIFVATGPFNDIGEHLSLFFVFIIFMELLLVEVYFAKKNRTRLLKMSFVFGILASYVVGVIQNAMGSSVVEASIVTVAAIAALYDLTRSLSQFSAGGRSNRRSGLKKVLGNSILAAAILSWLYLNYLQIGPAYAVFAELHAMGIATFLLLLALYYLSERLNPHSE
jgi:hypothetical protein